MHVSDNSELLRQFLHHSPIAMAMLDRELRYLAITPKWSKEFGVQATEILGMSHYKIFPKHGKRWREIHQHCLRGQQGQWQEPECLKPNGEIVAAQWTISPWLLNLSPALSTNHPSSLATPSLSLTEENSPSIDSENIGGLIFTWEDISLQKRVFQEACSARKSLHQKLQELQQILQYEKEERQRLDDTLPLSQISLNKSGDAVFWMGRDGDIFYVNDSACLSLGYSRDELLQLTIHEINPDFPPEIWPDYRDQVKEFGSFTLDSRHRRKDGKVFPVEITINSLVYKGQEYTCTFARDITERKRAEADLYQATIAAEAANQAKSSFLANMSHELRTPLNAIIGYSEILQEEVEDLEIDDEDIVSDLRSITTAGRHLLSIISDILDFSKIEAGKMDLVLEEFDVAALIYELESTVQPLVEKNTNTLKVECSLNLGKMYADQTKVRQVLLNLLSNAAKFTHQGTIVLTVNRQDSPFSELQNEAEREAESINNLSDPTAWICFRVSDTGIGMTEEQIQNIFQPFTQADESTTKRYGGTGLGLAITRRFCQMMGGDITVESRPNEGSTFTIDLPASNKSSEAKSIPDTDLQDTQKDSTYSISTNSEPKTWLDFDDQPLLEETAELLELPEFAGVSLNDLEQEFEDEDNTDNSFLKDAFFDSSFDDDYSFYEESMSENLTEENEWFA